MQPESSAKGLYDTDFAAWARHNASLLRQGSQLDDEQREQIAEELDGMARNDSREPGSRIVILLIHLLKIKCQSEIHTKLWDITIDTQREEIEALLVQSPSLRNCLDEALPRFYDRAKRRAKIEAGLTDFSRSWNLTVALQRNELQDILQQSPSLRPAWEADLPKLYTRAKKQPVSKQA